MQLAVLFQSCLVNANTCNCFVTSLSEKSQNDFETTVTCVYDTVCPTLLGKTPIRYMQTDPTQTESSERVSEGRAGGRREARVEVFT
jgi:hypothetical protein